MGLEMSIITHTTCRLHYYQVFSCTHRCFTGVSLRPRLFSINDVRRVTGGSVPVDDLDRCCMEHDQCYGKVTKRCTNESLLSTPHLTR